MLKQIRQKIAVSKKVVVVIQSSQPWPEAVVDRLTAGGLSAEFSMENWQKEPETVWSAVALFAKEDKPLRPVHRLLTRLEQYENLHRVFSFDWGCLEWEAGVDKKKIVKVYGNFDQAVCDVCCRVSSVEEYQQAVEFQSGPLACTDRSCRKTFMRPNIVFEGGRFTKDYLTNLVSTFYQADLVLLLLDDPEKCKAELSRILSRCGQGLEIYCISEKKPNFSNFALQWCPLDPDQFAEDFLEERADSNSSSQSVIELENTVFHREQCTCELL